MSSFPDLNPMWGVSKQEQAEEAPQRMEGGVVLNDFYKDIENLVNKNKIDNEFTIRKQRIHDGVPHHDKNEWFDLPHNDELPRTITNGICSPEDFGTLITMNFCKR